MTREAARRLSFAFLLGGLLLLGAVAAFAWPLNWDAAWYLEMASQFLDGQRLYVDVTDVNPPLIVWLSTIPVAIAEAVGMSAPVSFLLVVLSLFGISYWTSHAVLVAGWQDRAEVRRDVLVLLPVVLLILPMVNFGEREHLLMILAMPYLLLSAARTRPDLEPLSVVTHRRAAVLGAMAGLGVALKPHFVLLPLFLEGWLLARLGRRTWIARSELWTGLAVLLAYAILVPLLTPAYLDAVRLALGAYGAFDVSLGELLLQEEIYLVAGAGFAAWILWSRSETRGMGTTLAVASIALAAVAIVQRKGWGYHYYPALCSSALLLGLGVLELLRRTLGERRSKVAHLLLGTMLVGGLALFILPRALDPKEGPLGRLVDVVEREAAGGAVLVFSTQIGVAFPMVNYANVDWASRFPALWFLPRFYSEPQAEGVYPYRSPDEQGETEQRLFDMVVADFLEGEPELVLVVGGVPEPGFPLGNFDYIEYYSQDPRFARAFENYDRLGEVWPTVIYERRSGDPAEP